MTKPLVFVSYAHAEPAEAALARLIAERLRRDGAEVFIDEGLRTGQDWNAEIERRLDACDAFCPLLSATSVASPMVQAEIARVGERRRARMAPRRSGRSAAATTAACPTTSAPICAASST